MKCAEVYPLMQAYLDSAVTPDEERQVEVHIRACQRCRRRLVELARTGNRLADGRQVAPDSDFTRRLLERLQATDPEQSVTTPKGQPRR